MAHTTAIVLCNKIFIFSKFCEYFYFIKYKYFLYATQNKNSLHIRNPYKVPAKKVIFHYMRLYYFLVLAIFAFVACTEDSPSSPHSTVEKGQAYTFQVDSSYFINKFGTSHFKVVFRNELDNSAIFIENHGNEDVMKILDLGVNAYHFQFSPDGSKLAYCTTFEGSADSSDLYVLDLNSKKSKPVKLDAPFAAIPRWRVLENGDTAIVYVSNAASDLAPEWEQSATWQVVFKDGNFGKPKKLFDGSYHGGVAYDNSFAVTGAPRLFMYTAKDNAYTDLYNDEQVCNVSLARDSSKIFSFLDATGKMGEQFTNDPKYWWHKYIFFMNENGEIIKAISSPGTSVFDTPEWINIPNYEVGVLGTADGDVNQLVLIDVENSNVDIILVVDKDKYQIWHPDIWIEPKK